MSTYNYIFWNNPHESIWYAIPSDQYLTFFNGNRSKAKGVLKDNDITKLVKLINNDK